MKQHTTKRKTGHGVIAGTGVSACTTVAVDLAKRVFQIAGEDAHGRVMHEQRIASREAFQVFLRTLPAGLTVLMEVGPGAQAWARQVQAQGNVVRILPAQRVGEHRSGAKNDRNDARAILRAGHDASIAAVPVKRREALAMQALHRVRHGCVRRRTALGNQMRGLLLEHGIALAQGAAALTCGVNRVLEDATQPIPHLLRALIADMQAEWQRLGERIEGLSGQLETAARGDATARRLMTVRGVGPLIATAVIAKQTEPARFANARRFAAYFGIVPDQHSSGQRVRLGRMSKRGDAYLRSLLIQGAQAVLQQLPHASDQPDDRRLLRWRQRLGCKGAAVRLANRNLRIIWVLLQTDQVYRRQPARQADAAQTTLTS